MTGGGDSGQKRQIVKKGEMPEKATGWGGLFQSSVRAGSQAPAERGVEASGQAGVELR